MELGYLTPEGCLVVADSLGRRFLFKGYRIDAAGRYTEVLGFRRPLEPVASVTIEVTLHRSGWAGPGEILLRGSPGRLHRGKTRHYVVGSDWRSLRRKDWNLDPYLYRPWFGSRGVGRLAPRIPKGTPFFVTFSDGAVKGCRRNGATVELFAVELKEFTDFVLGKLKATLRFDTEAAADAFAGQFPAVADLAALDAAVPVEVERSRKYRRPKRVPLAKWEPKPLSKAGGRKLVYWVVVLMIESVVVAATRLPPATLVFVPVTIVVGVGVAVTEQRRRRTVERQDLVAKFPARVWERFPAQVPGLAGGFVLMLRERGITLDPFAVDLAPVDKVLRDLPPDTCYGAPILSAGALVAGAFLASLGRKVQSSWTLDARSGLMVLQIRDAYWISPLTWVSKVWVSKPKETLQETLDLWVDKVRSALAFSHRVAFLALGFAPDGRLPEALMTRVRQDAEAVAPESFVLGDRHLRRRRIAYGPFSLDLVEGEYVDRRGPRFLPLLAVPFFPDAQEVRGKLDGSSPRSPAQEDVAVIRLAGQPMVPLGIQVRNFVEVGPDFGSPDGELGLRLLAVSDKVEILTPRMREMNPEVKDFLVPMDPREDGVPLNPYARFLGRIEGVRETANPVTDTGLWRLRVDISGFRLDMLVRKDRCPAVPAVGSYVSGNLWLVADLVPGKGPSPDYIR